MEQLADRRIGNDPLTRQIKLKYNRQQMETLYKNLQQNKNGLITSMKGQKQSSNTGGKECLASC